MNNSERRKLIIPSTSQFMATRLLESAGKVADMTFCEATESSDAFNDGIKGLTETISNDKSGVIEMTIAITALPTADK